MPRTKTGLWLAIVALSALVAGVGAADAAVIIKTVLCAICVTDTKHPDACKDVTADGRVVVSEDVLKGLEGELGEGATIMMATSKRPAPPSGNQERRRRHLDQDQLPPPD